MALAMVRAYNDWHIDEWCGTHPGRFIPCPLPAIWDPEVLAAEVRRTRRQGRPRRHLLGEPVQAGLAEHPLRPLGPVLEGLQRRGGGRVHAHRLVLAAGHHLARRPDRRADHPHPHEHRAGGGRPRLVAGAAQVPRPQVRPLRGRHRLDPLLPRAASTTTTRSTTPGPARTSATSCRARSSTSTSSPASSTTTSAWPAATSWTWTT